MSKELGLQLVAANQQRAGIFPLATREKCFAALDQLVTEAIAARELNDDLVHVPHELGLVVKEWIWKLEEGCSK